MLSYRPLKIYIESGETREIVFEIIPREHLSFPDNFGNIILEDGTFILTVGNLTQRFYLTSDSAVKTIEQEGRSHLQEEI